MLAATSSRAFDGLALTLSGLCIVHCLALPLAAVGLPFLGLWAEAEWVHWGFVVAAVAASTAAFGPSFRERGAWPLIGLAGAGLILLMLGAAGWPRESAETPLTVLGGGLLAAAHVCNWRRAPAHPRR